jgi:type IV secretion system protein VirB10
MSSALPPSMPPSAESVQDGADSAVFTRGVAPTVRQSSSPWSLALGLIGALLMGGVAFERLSAAREANEAKAAAAGKPAPAAPVARTSPPPNSNWANHGPPPMIHPAAQPSAFTPVVSGPDTETQRLRAPLMVVDLGDGGPAPAAARAVPGGSIPSPDDAGRSAEERFAARVSASNVETSRATRLHDLAHIIPQGTVIPAVLETAINSDLPGSTRAIVSRDVRSFDGSQILIPRGSSLIGQYRNGVAYGQHRAFVIWSRVLTPDGISIDIGSPGTDPLGRGGLSGETDSHFFQRFGSSILLSVLSAGVAAVARGGSDTAIILGSPLQAQSLASQVPQKNDIPVTVKVMQGTPMSVFLTRDLDFSDVAAAQ